jgi:hypothetical protein
MEDTRGNMDIRQHRGMWRAFTALVKWVIILNVILLVLMAIFLT